MLINDVRNFFSGYLIVKIEGLSLERMINAAVNQKIKLWGVRRPNYQELTAHITIQSFRKLRVISKEHNSRIRILAKRGLPFKTHRLKRRKMIPVGFLIFLLFLYGLSSFIWIVELEGVENADRQTIMDALSEKGIKPGAFKLNLDVRSIENMVLNEIPELIWIGIELRGSKAIINVQKSTKPPDMLDPLAPFNIVAKRDGIVEKIVVLDGEAMVSAGDTVKKDQLLVSGIMQDNDIGTIRYAHARAQVFARTWYESRAVIAFKNYEYERTGKKVVHQYMNCKGLIVTKEYYEIREIPILIDCLKNQAKEDALNDLLVKIPNDAKIIDKRVKYDMIKDKEIVATVYAEVLEDIAQKRRIEINREEIFIVGQRIEREYLYHRQDG